MFVLATNLALYTLVWEAGLKVFAQPVEFMSNCGVVCFSVCFVELTAGTICALMFTQLIANSTMWIGTGRTQYEAEKRQKTGVGPTGLPWSLGNVFRMLCGFGGGGAISDELQRDPPVGGAGDVLAGMLAAAAHDLEAGPAKSE